MMHLVVLATGGAALVYSCLLLLLWRFQERIVFQPPADVSPNAAPAMQVRYFADDGVELFAYVVGDCTPRDHPVVIAFHGNADTARRFIPWATRLAHEAGACILLPEYRGYDGLDGRPTYATTALDAQAALEYARHGLHAAPGTLVYFGHSLGSAVAAELAAVQPPRSLVLQSPLSSARELGSHRYLPGLGLFWGLVSRVHFDTLSRVRDLAAPVWVAHGDKDFIIPVRMGRRVHAAAAHPGDLLIVHGAGHNDVPEIGGPAYWAWIVRAVRGREPVTRAAPAETRSEP